MPIHTSKRSAYLLGTKLTEHIMAASHFPIFKSITLLFFSFFLPLATQKNTVYFFPERPFSVTCVSQQDKCSTTHMRFILLQPSPSADFFSMTVTKLLIATFMENLAMWVRGSLGNGSFTSP